MLTLDEVAAKLRVSKKTVEREIRDGRLAAVKIRSRRRVTPESLARYIATQGEGAPCQSGSGEIAGKSGFALAADVVLSELSRPASKAAPTRSRSRVRSSAPKPTLQLVGGRT